MSEIPGHTALAQIDQVLAEQPKHDGALLSGVTLNLTEFRKRLIERSRQHGLDAAQRTQLRHVNAVITIVLGIHFPLGEIPWAELPKARAWLADAVAMQEPAA